MWSKPTLVVGAAALIGALIGSVVTGVTTTADAAGGDIPRGAVVAFTRTDCPNGWTSYAKAQGRVIVGVRPGGSVGGVIGGRLNDLQKKKHGHTVDVESTPVTGTDHKHSWSNLSDGTWSDGAGTEIISGNKGGAAGSAWYPLAATSSSGVRVYFTGGPVGSFEFVNPPATGSTKSWNGVPYVQLTYCKKK